MNCSQSRLPLSRPSSDSMTAIRCPFTVVKAAMPLPPCRMPVARAICSASSGKSLFSRFSRSMPRVLNRVFKALGRYGTISSIGYACPRKSSCYAADISGRWRCDRFRICGRSVFGTIDGAVRVRYIRQEPFFIMFSGTNLLRGSCDMLLQGIIFIDF